MNTQKTGFTFLLLGIFFFQAEAQENLTAVKRQQIIDSLSAVLNQKYVYPGKAVAMSNFIRQQNKKGLYNAITDPKQFASQLAKDLRSVQQDNHLAVRYAPELEQKIRAYVATGQKDQSETEKERSENFFFRKVEILNGNIGYLAFTNFADTGELSRKTVRAALQFVANADALIIDLRNNFGGRPAMAQEIAGYFFNKRQFAGRTFNRISNTWTEEWLTNEPGITQGLYLGMPLYILTSERTFSAAEGFAYTLQHVRNAVIVGDTTRGGAHATRSFALGNGFAAFVPFTRLENAVTKTDWEGVGVIPNVSINEDMALLQSQQLILLNRVATTRDTTEKLKLQWLLNDLQSKMMKVFVPLETLQQYTGTFEEFEFTLEGGQLYCHNTHQPNKKDLLIPVNEHLFTIDNQSQVDFLKNETGSVTAIKLLWNDGWVDIIKKNK